MAEMERIAEDIIPDLKKTSIADNGDVQDNDQKSVLSDDTAELVEKLQRTVRQLVAFDDLVDSTAMIDNEDCGEDDDYMLQVLKDKDTFTALSTQAPPFGVMAVQLDKSEGKKPKATVAKRALPQESEEQDVSVHAASKKPRTEVPITSMKGKPGNNGGGTGGGGGKMRTPKQSMGSGAKKSTSKAKSTPKTSAKRTLSTSTTTKKATSGKQGGAATRRSPTCRAKETEK
ncbi:hypothetical protein ACA910_022455 [Epithemia clementina (nom. ined.)]